MGKKTRRLLAAVRSDKIIHPKSRKARQLNRFVKRSAKMEQKRKTQNHRIRNLGNKLAWIKDNLEDVDHYTPSMFKKLIKRYINRHADEIEQIEIVKSIGGGYRAKKGGQHVAREHLIRVTKERESEEYTGCGLEFPNLLNKQNFEYLKNWDGERRLISNIKVGRITKSYLDNKETLVNDAGDENMEFDDIENDDSKATDSDEDIDDDEDDDGSTIDEEPDSDIIDNTKDLQDKLDVSSENKS